MRVCVTCGKEFKPQSQKHRYCVASCNPRYKGAIRIKGQLEAWDRLNAAWPVVGPARMGTASIVHFLTTPEDVKE